MIPTIRFLLLACVIAIAGCATSHTTAVHQTLSGEHARALPHRLLLLPAEVRVHEVSAGGVVEKVDAWSESASKTATAHIREIGAARGYELTESPPLSPQDREVLQQHVALYSLVAGSAFFAQHSQAAAWRERGKTFDYSLGPGLKDLAEHTGLDAAVITVGTDYISSSGRRAAMLASVLVGIATGVVIVPPAGVAFMSVGLVDLRTGDLLWFDTQQSQNIDLREEKDVKRAIDVIFETQPGQTQAAPPKK
jgi:hypothetical protein